LDNFENNLQVHPHRTGDMYQHARLHKNPMEDKKKKRNIFTQIKGS
jgi:hypothetical protein